MTDDSKERIHEELTQVADELGHPPQATQFFVRAGISQYEFYTEYDRYNQAVRDAGLDPDDIPQDVMDTDLSKDELRERIHEVALSTDGALKMNETLREAQVSRTVVYDYYDTWSECLGDLGLGDRAAT